MRITGSHTVEVPRERLWAALHDPAVLARTLPGCQQLEVIGDDTYAATVTAGVASIRGTYTGQVRLHEKDEPTAYKLVADGAGGPGTIHADAAVRLEDGGGSTTIHYDADAVVGGMIGGVGQRMIAGAARRTAGEFFDAVANDVLHGPAGGSAAAAAAGEELAGVGAGAPAPTFAGDGAGEAAATPAVGQVFPGRAPAAAGAGGGPRLEVLVAFALGAAVALAGVWVGRHTVRGDPGRRDGSEPAGRSERAGRAGRRTSRSS